MSATEFEFPLAYERTLDARIGVRRPHPNDTADVRHGTLTVAPHHCDRHGALAGGVLATIAEGLASQGTLDAVLPGGCSAQGLSNDTTLLTAVGPGAEVESVARMVSQAESEWVWTIVATAQDGTPVALSRVTVAVRPLRPPV